MILIFKTSLIFENIYKFATAITGALAQLVEQRTENPCVPGSIPGGTTKLKKAPILGLFNLKNFSIL